MKEGAPSAAALLPLPWQLQLMVTARSEGSDHTDRPQPTRALSTGSTPRHRTGTTVGAWYLEEFLLKPKCLRILLCDQAGEVAQGGCPAGGLGVVG